MQAKEIAINWNPDLPIYAAEGFLKAAGDRYGWLGGFDDAGTLRCILPYTIVRKAILRMARFRVQTLPMSAELSISEEKAFLNSAMDVLRSLGADMVVPASTNTIFRTHPDGAVAVPYGTYIMDLTLSEDQLWANMSSSHRRKVRLAQKDGVQIRDGMSQLPVVYELVRDTFKRSALPFMSYEDFNRQITGLGEHVKVLVAACDNVVHGGIVAPFSKYGAYYVYGGSIPEPKNGAMNLLHWEAVRLFQGLGVKRYDFVGSRISPAKGSKQEGLKSFKERFGGQFVQGYMWKCSFNRLKFLMYCLAARYRTGGDIVDQEQQTEATSQPAASVPEESLPATR